MRRDNRGDNVPTRDAGETGFAAANGSGLSFGIEVEGLTKRVHGTEVLRDVTLSVPAGTTVGLSGPNGSGKTMLMRAVLGLIRPTEGFVAIDGKRLWRDISFPPSAGLLLEGPAFLSSRSGVDNLELLASIRGVVGRDACERAMAGVGLDPADKRPFRKYSLGMKQRLGIAGAVLEVPDLLVLDEPTNALDSSGVEMLKGIVRREQKRGATILLACHDADILRELSDEICYLAEGHVDGHETLGGKRGGACHAA